MARHGLYQPFIEDRNVRRLFQLKIRFKTRLQRHMPMTVLVNRILDDYFDAHATEEGGELASSDRIDQDHVLEEVGP
ncbi:MAG: hypothetical protein ABIQ65_14940 [Thermoanaerobaculia bacterium]